MNSSSAEVIALASPREDEGAGRRQLFSFLTLVLGATAIPLLLLPAAALVNPDALSLMMLAQTLTFLGGTAHVSATGFFYANRDFQSFFLRRPVRYLVVPFVLVAATAAFFHFASPAGQVLLLAGYFIWQTYHYQRQNYGIYVFYCQGLKKGRPGFWEAAVLEAGVMSGILGLFRLLRLGEGTELAVFSEMFFAAGQVLACLMPVLFVLAIWRSEELRRDLPRCLLLAFFGGFYLTTFAFESVLAAVSSYALAHGLQYLVFMFYVARHREDARRYPWLAILVAITFVGGLGLLALSDKGLWGSYGNAFFGGYLGLVMAHFVVDAGIWRFRDAFPRQQMQDVFGFLKR